MTHKSVILCILDGWGIDKPTSGNAITLTKTPAYSNLLETCPNSQLEAAGFAVGLPADQDGNSETGHLNLGAGRIVFQDLARINMSIADFSFFSNDALLSAINHVQKNHSALHLMGLVGSSGVHAYNDHLYALLMLAKRHCLEKVYLHLFTDGRDSPPHQSPEIISKVEDIIAHYKVGKIVSLSGRYYGMDRDMRLDRTQKAYDCIAGRLEPNAKTASEAIKNSYDLGITDEFLLPTTIGKDFRETRIRKDDGLIFYNFRIDRPRQLTKMILEHHIENLHVVTMTQYHPHFPVRVAFPNSHYPNILGEVLAQNSLKQLRVSESEKERFVTYYFNGQREEPFALEDRVIVASPKVATYDLQPEMSTSSLLEAISSHIKDSQYSFILVNIACPDMVAHTGNLAKSKLAVKATDAALKQLVEIASQNSSCLLITADHGNIEQLINQTSGEIDTQHSTNPVPLIFFDKDLSSKYSLSDGILADVAPTVLFLLDLAKPPEMTGHNLLIQKK